ncbi:Uncharacterised protein [Serratia fonticola]|uniref:Uncharacterized protein n=1 Tax=Serratia fonticola TaxID=47917 RepID=A0A4U9UAN7_SERFO|nr:Uncharacterised protein [Serratia fonticola]
MARHRSFTCGNGDNLRPLSAVPLEASTVIGAWKRLSRSALPSTKTLESAIAAAAKIGESKVPFNG